MIGRKPLTVFTTLERDVSSPSYRVATVLIPLFTLLAEEDRAHVPVQDVSALQFHTALSQAVIIPFKVLLTMI